MLRVRAWRLLRDSNTFRNSQHRHNDHDEEGCTSVLLFWENQYQVKNKLLPWFKFFKHLLVGGCGGKRCGLVRLRPPRRNTRVSSVPEWILATEKTCPTHEAPNNRTSLYITDLQQWNARNKSKHINEFKLISTSNRLSCCVSVLKYEIMRQLNLN